VEHVGQHLVVGVGVDGGHQSGFDADGLIEHLGHRRQAVGGARGIRDDVITVLEDIVVDAIDHRRQVLAGRRRDQHLARAGTQMRRGFFLAGEEAGAFHHHVDPQLAPGQLARIALGQHPDAVAVDDHRIALDADLGVELAVRGVVARQVGIGVRVAQIIDRDNPDFAGTTGFVERAQHVAADAAIAIDGNLDGHGSLPKQLEKVISRIVLPPAGGCGCKSGPGMAETAGSRGDAGDDSNVEPEWWMRQIRSAGGAASYGK